MSPEDFKNIVINYPEAVRIADRVKELTDEKRYEVSGGFIIFEIWEDFSRDENEDAIIESIIQYFKSLNWQEVDFYRPEYSYHYKLRLKLP